MVETPVIFLRSNRFIRPEPLFKLLPLFRLKPEVSLLLGWSDHRRHAIQPGRRGGGKSRGAEKPHKQLVHCVNALKLDSSDKLQHTSRKSGVFILSWSAKRCRVYQCLVSS